VSAPLITLGHGTATEQRLTALRCVPVAHLFHDGHLVTHEPAVGARLTPEGLLVYDG